MRNDGWNLRLDILRQDAKSKLLNALMLHGWDAAIEMEVHEGEYLVVKATRGDVSRKAALLYSSGTANEVYKRLDSQVDAILFNGQPYKLDSFAYGIMTPVLSADDFQSVLVQWNQDSSSGKLSPSQPVVEPSPSGTRHRFLLSETPIDAIWARLGQLRSATLAEKMVMQRAKLGNIELEAAVIRSKGEGVAFSLRNATDYFGTEVNRNLSQRVLNLYYGTLSFAFAEMLSVPSGPKTLGELEAITKQGHGLYTLDGSEDGLDNLAVGVLASGFFQAWAKSVSTEKLSVVEKKPRDAKQLATLPIDSWLTLEQLFSRIPEVADLFEDIFDSKPGWITPAYDTEANGHPGIFGSSLKPKTSYVLLIDDTGRLTVNDVVKFPGPFREIAQAHSNDHSRHFRAAVDHPGKDNWWGALSLHHSPFERTALILPIFGNFNDYRGTCLALLYALSIVVRYRPSLWRRIQEGDLDHWKALIEAFVAVVERVLPEQFLSKISGRPVSVHQPGSLFS